MTWLLLHDVAHGYGDDATFGSKRFALQISDALGYLLPEAFWGPRRCLRLGISVGREL